MKNKALVLFLSIFSLISFISLIALTSQKLFAPPNFQASVFFSPSGQIQSQIIKAIDGSKDAIDIALYELTSSEISKSLESARDRGVKIRIVADKLQASDKNTLIPSLTKKGFETKLLSGVRIGENTGSMHHKFAIFDHKLLEVGSYNWTYSAENLNHESALFITDKKTVEEYQSEFDRLWTL